MNSEAIFNLYISAMDKQLKNHTVRVVDMCTIFANNLDLNDERKKILLNAAWLHDIAKFNNKDNHHKKYVKAAVESTMKPFQKI